MFAKAKTERAALKRKAETDLELARLKVMREESALNRKHQLEMMEKQLELARIQNGMTSVRSQAGATSFDIGPIGFGIREPPSMLSASSSVLDMPTPGSMGVSGSDWNMDNTFSQSFTPSFDFPSNNS